MKHGTYVTDLMALPTGEVVLSGLTRAGSLQMELVEADIQLALEDVSPNDTQALYKRCSRILDDIHSGRF